MSNEPYYEPETARIVSRLYTDDGDNWVCYVTEDGAIRVNGNDIGWEDRDALDHGLVLSDEEALWLEVANSVAARISRRITEGAR